MLPTDKIFDPKFLNLEYFFNQIYIFFHWLFNAINHYVFGDILSSGNGAPANCTFFDCSPLFSSLKGIFSIISIFLITVIVYSLLRLHEIIKEEKMDLEKIITLPPEETPKNEKWQVVIDRVNSLNPSDWKLAILEADNMLDELIRRKGYRGENLGERLKAVEPSDLTNIQSAWEAHKVRNRIAHEGSEFFLSQREARRIVGLYEQVFKEFRVI